LLNRRLMKRIGTALVILGAFTGCGGGDGAGGAEHIECVAFPLTSPLVEPGKVLDWEPLGLVNGLSHTFPTDHQYVRVADPEVPGYQEQNVYAPADLILREVGESDRNGRTEYEANLLICDEVSMGIAHMQSFSEELLQLMGEPVECETYDRGGGPITKCYRRGELHVPAGTLLGTAGHSENPYLDVGALDERHENQAVSPREPHYARLHAVSALDLFAPEIRSQYAGVVGRYGERRTALPIGGTIEVDVAGTAQGHWYAPGVASTDEFLHFALVPDFIDPDGTGAASLGASLVEGGGDIVFGYESSGLRNRRPSDITDDGQTYCFDNGNRALLVEMPSVTQLRAQAFADSSCEDSLAFDSGAFVFER